MTKDSGYTLSFVPMDAYYPETSLFCCWCGKHLPTRILPVSGNTHTFICSYCGEVLEVRNIVCLHTWEVKRV